MCVSGLGWLGGRHQVLGCAVWWWWWWWWESGLLQQDTSEARVGWHPLSCLDLQPPRPPPPPKRAPSFSALAHLLVSSSCRAAPSSCPASAATCSALTSSSDCTAGVQQHARTVPECPGAQVKRVRARGVCCVCVFCVCGGGGVENGWRAEGGDDAEEPSCLLPRSCCPHSHPPAPTPGLTCRESLSPSSDATRRLSSAPSARARDSSSSRPATSPARSATRISQARRSAAMACRAARSRERRGVEGGGRAGSVKQGCSGAPQAMRRKQGTLKAQEQSATALPLPCQGGAFSPTHPRVLVHAHACMPPPPPFLHPPPHAPPHLEVGHVLLHGGVAPQAQRGQLLHLGAPRLGVAAGRGQRLLQLPHRSRVRVACAAHLCVCVQGVPYTHTGMPSAH